MANKKLIIGLIIIIIVVIIVLGLVSLKISRENKRSMSITNSTIQNVDSGNEKLDAVTSDLPDREIIDDSIISDENMTEGFD